MSIVASLQFFRVVSTRHVASLHVVAFVLSGYQTFKPDATFHPINTGERNVKEWVQFGLLATVGAFIPLVSPRPFIASVSTTSVSTSASRWLLAIKAADDLPNPEATASYLSLLTFSFLDPLIWKAYTVPHLSTDQLPPLQEMDSSASLTAHAFPVIDYCYFISDQIRSNPSYPVRRSYSQWFQQDTSPHLLASI